MPKTPSWDSITTQESYQSLSPEMRTQLKQEYFKSHIAPTVEKDEALRDVGADKVFNWFMQQPDDSGQGYVSSMAGSAGRGFGEIVPGAIEGVGALTGLEGVRGAGQSIREGLEEISPVNPVYQESFPVQASGVVGQVGSTILTAGAGGAIGKTLGGIGAISRGAQTAALGSAALQGAAEGRREADKYGMTGGDAYLRTLAGAATEVGSEMLPFGLAAETRAAQRVLGAAPRAGRFTTDVLTEGAEEATAQSAGNIATMGLAPEGVETPGALDGTLEAAALGAVGGTVFGGVNALVAPSSPDADFAARAAMEGATEFTPAPVPVGETGTVIQAGAPAVLTPDFVEGLGEADLIELEKLGHIKRAPPVTPPADASAPEQEFFEETAANVVEAGPTVAVAAAAAREADAEISAAAAESPTPESEITPEGGEGSQLQSAEEGSIPSVTTDIVAPQAEEASVEIEPAQTNETAEQPDIEGTGGVDGPEVSSDGVLVPADEPRAIKQDASVSGPAQNFSLAALRDANRVELSPQAQARWTPEVYAAAEQFYATGDETALAPLTKLQRRRVLAAQAAQESRPEIVSGDPVALQVGGNNVMGTVTEVKPDGTAEVDYTWNGEDYAHVTSLLKKLRRPARSLTDGPSYEYTQEQNARKAARFGLPTTAGITVDAGSLITESLRKIAKDTALSPLIRAAARALDKIDFQGVDLRVETDGRRKFAGYYLNDEGITEIGLNMRQVARGNVDMVGTFIHEALHHATLAKVRDPQTEIEKQAVEALTQIVQRVRTYAGLQEKGRKFSYETSNVEEFISALFTRADFQNFLASIPDNFAPKTGAGKFRSLLSEIFRIIAQLVTGHKVAKGSTMEQAMTGSLVLFETPQRTIETGPLNAEAVPARDAEYLAAVESGDLAKAQAMVNDAAKKAGYDTKVFHGTKDKGFNTFNKTTGTRAWYGEGVYVTRSRDGAKWYAGKDGRIIEGWARVLNPKQITTDGQMDSVTTKKFTEKAKADGYDSIEVTSADMRDGDNSANEVILFEPSQIKSADPVTRDSQGRIIPLSERFNDQSDSILYSKSQEDSEFTPMPVEQARAVLEKRFGRTVAEKIHLGHFGPVRGSMWDGVLLNGEIGINLNHIPDESVLVNKVEHEMGHAVWQDSEVQQAWADLRASMPADVSESIQRDIEQLGYRLEDQDQERMVRFLEMVRAGTSPSKFQKFLDTVLDALRRLFGMQPNASTARLVAARIIAAAEKAIAEGTSGNLENTLSSLIELAKAGNAQFSLRESQSRFAPPNPADRLYPVLTQAENDRQRDAWINPLGTLTAARVFMDGKAPPSMETSIKENIAGTLLVRLTEMSVDPALSEDQQTVARVLNTELGKYWQKMLSQDPARALQQRSVQTAKLFPFAPILAAEEILVDRAEKIVKARFDGGSEGAVVRVNAASEASALGAGERVERILQTLFGSMSPKQTAMGELARMFRGTGQRDQMIEEVAQALMQKSRGTVVTPERKTALAQLVSSLKATLNSKVQGEDLKAPEATMPELLTRAFVNQVAEAEMFTESWEAGRQKVLDMLIDMELDKSFHPMEKQVQDLRSRLTHLEAGSEQQMKDSEVERNDLARQIKDLRDQMEAERKAVLAKTPQLMKQRDGMMPPSPTMAFEPGASRESISRAFEQAGYTAEIATGLDKSGKRTLSMQDALRNRPRAVAAVMKVFDDAMTGTPSEWAAARPVAQRAVEETLDAWQKRIDENKASVLEAQRASLLDEQSKPLVKLINSIRAKVSPGMRWADLFANLSPNDQAERAREIRDRILKHPALQNLSSDEQAALEKEISRVWQHERQKAFKKELKKVGALGEKSVIDRAKVFAVAPKLLRFLNLGVFNASTFREAISKEYGLKTLTTQEASDLRQQAAAAWKEPEGILRNRKLRDMLTQIQTITKASWSEIMGSYWTASILSGLRTQFDTFMAVINGFGTNLIQSGIAMGRARSVQAGLDAHLQWWRGLMQGIQESVLVLHKGDTSYLKRFGADINRALEGEKGASPVPIGEKLWREGNVFQKFPAAVMIFTGRLMTAADHINNTATTQGAMAIARALHPELYDGKVGFTAAETADARQQAIREALGGKSPDTFAERRLVDARAREILNSSVRETERQAASDIGDIAAYQNDPSGFFGAIHGAIKAGLGHAVRKFDEVADDENANRFTRAITAAAAGSVHAITGTRFMRFGFNFGNDIIRYIPGSYLLDKLGFFGRETSPMERDLLLGKNVIGMAIVSIVASMFADDDEEKDGEWHMDGDWSNLSFDEQSKRRGLGLQPMSFWKRENGKTEVISYKQWATMGVIAPVGNMQDEKRFKPDVWAERGVDGHLLNAVQSGFLQVQNVSAMRGLGDLFGSSSSQGNSVEAWKDKLAHMGTNYVGGYVPTAVKDIDVWSDPRNFKPEGVMEGLMTKMPIARRYVNDGRPQLNLLGDDVTINRKPWSRLTTTTEQDEATQTLGWLLTQGHDLQMPNSGRLVFVDGKKVPLDTLGRQIAWEYEKAVGQGYKAWLQADGEKLRAMPVQQRDRVIDKRSKIIRDNELRKVQAAINQR